MQEPAPPVTLGEGQVPYQNWLEYVYRTAHPTLRWLPTKLAEWIGENLQEELGFPDKADKRAEPGTGWTAAELNGILHNHVVNGILTSFGCVEWKSDLFRGVMRAKCYPFDAKEALSLWQPKGQQYILSDYIILYTNIIMVYTSIY